MHGPDHRERCIETGVFRSHRNQAQARNTTVRTSYSTPFVDGKKRTGLSSALTFLDGNDFSIADDSRPYFDERTLFAGMIGIAAHGWTRDDFSELLMCAATQTTFAGILPKVPW
jgi:hypothetical protein